jgi:PAS domain S-box-containing protein
MAQPGAELMRTLASLRFPSYIVARNGMLTWLNDSAKRAFGDLEGKPLSSFVAPEDLDLALRQLDRKLRGAPATEFEIDVFTADGRRRRVEISSVPIRGGDECHAVFGIALPRAHGSGARTAELTPRQMQVLRLLGEGASTNHVAATLHLSRETVRNHVRHVLRALGAHSRLEAVAIARRRGLLRDQ